MTQLRKMMLEELERRNYSQSTVRAYVRTIRDLARYFNRPPDQLGPDHFANTKHIYSVNANWLPTQSTSELLRFDFSSWRR